MSRELGKMEGVLLEDGEEGRGRGHIKNPASEEG